MSSSYNGYKASTKPLFKPYRRPKIISLPRGAMGSRGNPIVIQSGGRVKRPVRSGGFYGGFDRTKKEEEKKVLDIAAADTNVSNAGTFVLLNGIAEGDDFNNRQGRLINIKSLHCRWYSGPPTNQASENKTGGDVLRIIWFIDKQPNGAAPTTAELLAAAEPTSPLNLNYRHRFNILCDEFIPIDPFTTDAGSLLATGGPNTKAGEFYRKLNFQSVYNGTAGTIGAISTNSLYMFYILDNSDSCAFKYYNRIRFDDP